MMRILQRITVLIFAVVLCLFVLFAWKEQVNADDSWPEVLLETPELEVGIQLSTQELLAGVTAQDEKDGDLTDKILIESISPFLEKGVSKITYAVCDSDNHVAKAQRLVHFQNYTSPKFYLKQPLVFSTSDKVNIRELIGAVDCMEGDISSQITVVGTDYMPPKEGTFTLSIQVTNQLGDLSHLSIPIVVEDLDKRAPKIALTDALIYVEQNHPVDFASKVAGVTLQEMPVTEYTTEIVTDFNPSVAGTYAVHYYVTAANGAEGHTVLTVVVEE